MLQGTYTAGEVFTSFLALTEGTARQMELRAAQGQDMSITQMQLSSNYLFIFYRHYLISIYFNKRLSFPPLHYCLQNCRLCLPPGER